MSIAVSSSASPALNPYAQAQNVQANAPAAAQVARPESVKPQTQAAVTQPDNAVRASDNDRQPDRNVAAEALQRDNQQQASAQRGTLVNFTA